MSFWQGKIPFREICWKQPRNTIRYSYLYNFSCFCFKFWSAYKRYLTIQVWPIFGKPQNPCKLMLFDYKKNPIKQMSCISQNLFCCCSNSPQNTTLTIRMQILIRSGVFPLLHVVSLLRHAAPLVAWHITIISIFAYFITIMADCTLR